MMMMDGCLTYSGKSNTYSRRPYVNMKLILTLFSTRPTSLSRVFNMLVHRYNPHDESTYMDIVVHAD